MGTGRASSTNNKQLTGNDVRVSFPNANLNSMSDLESLDKITKLKAELDSYQKLLLTKLSNDSQQHQQIASTITNDMMKQSVASDRSLKSIINNQVRKICEMYLI